jgi:segregation and condensation protein B
MELSNLIPHIEALIFASDKPLTSAEITELINSAFGFMEDKLEQPQIDAAIEGIIEKYSSEFYPFEVRESGGGWQFLTKKDYHKTVAQLNGEKFLKRLSAAALETLAIIAYKQPVTKGEIEAIRGVSSDYAVQKLLEKDLIMISGRNEKLPGHPLVYATSKNFMDYFGINSPDDLPKIREVLADQIVEPTIVNHTDFEQSETLAVSDSGELIAAIEDGDNPDEAAGEETLNGHAFEELDPGEEGETLADEAAEEEFINDEVIKESDEEEAEDELIEELNEELTEEEEVDEAEEAALYIDEAEGEEADEEDEEGEEGEADEEDFSADEPEEEDENEAK